MIISIILFVFMFLVTAIVKLALKNKTNDKLKKFDEIVELALIAQFLIIINNLFFLF